MSYLRRLIRWLFGMEIPPPLPGPGIDHDEDLDGPDGPHGRPTV